MWSLGRAWSEAGIRTVSNEMTGSMQTILFQAGCPRSVRSGSSPGWTPPCSPRCRTCPRSPPRCRTPSAGSCTPPCGPRSGASASEGPKLEAPKPEPQIQIENELGVLKPIHLMSNTLKKLLDYLASSRIEKLMTRMSSLYPASLPPLVTRCVSNRCCI